MTGLTTRAVTATSGTVSGTSDSVGAEQDRIPAEGWHVRLFPAGASGAVVPAPTGDIAWQPTVNDRPQLRVPVEKDDRYLAPAFDECDAAAYHDGQRVAIDRLVNVQQRADASELVLEGAGETRDRVQAELTSQPAHEFARDLIEQNTPYKTNITTPGGAPETETLQQLSTDADFSAAVSVDDDVPWRIREPAPVAFTTESTQFAFSGSGLQQNSAFSNDEAEGLLNSGESVSFSFDLEHRIPESRVRLYLRYTTGSPGTFGTAPAVEATLNGSTWAIFPDGGSSQALNWRDFAFDAPGSQTGTYSGGDLTPGTYTVTIEATSSQSDNFIIDVAAPLDAEYEGGLTFDDDTPSGERVSGPELFPAALPIEFGTQNVVRSVVGADLSLGIDNTGGNQALAVSNDGGNSFENGTNTDSLSVSFPDAGGSATARVTLSRFGSRTNATPTSGFNPQTLSSLQLDADLVDIPVLTQKSYDNSLLSVLQRVADFGDFVFEFRADGDQTVFELAQAGDRPGAIDPDIVDFSVNRRSGDVYGKAVVFGSSRSVSNQRFVADVGTAVSLTDGRIQEGQVSVFDPDTGENFSEGDDYRVEYQAGDIIALTGGNLTDGQTYAASYEVRPQGSFSVDGFDPATDTTLVETIPAVTDSREADQAAIVLANIFSTPPVSAEVTVPTLDPSLSLVDALSVAGLPTDENLEVRDIQSSPGETVVQLGSRPEGIGEVIGRLSARLSGAAEQV